MATLKSEWARLNALVTQLVSPAPPSAAERLAKASEAATRTAVAASKSALFQPTLEQGSPFNRVVVSARSVACGVAATQLPMFRIATPGQRLLLSRSGTPPNARFNLDLGGRMVLFQPGTEIVAPFESIGLVSRQHVIPLDLNNNSGFGFQGEAAFIISTSAQAAYSEPTSGYGTQPFFRPVNILGEVDNPNSANHWVGPSSSGAVVQLALGGAQRVRFYFAQKNFPGGSTATVVSGDDVQMVFYESVAAYDESGNTNLFPFIGSAHGAHLSGGALVFTWGADDLNTIDKVVTPTQDVMVVVLTVANGHSVYWCAEGVA